MKKPIPILSNAVLVFFSVLLFCLAHPNFIFKDGIPFLAWFMYLPAMVVIRRVSLSQAPLWGALYGFVSMSVFASWISTYNLVAGVFVSLVYLFYFEILFFALKIAVLIFPKRGFLVQLLLFIAFEYLRTKGFLGFGYGISGYTQWQIIPLLQIANLTGVWGVSLLVIFPSLFFARIIDPNSLKIGKNPMEFDRNLTRIDFLPAAIWVLFIILVFIYGFSSKNDYSAQPDARIALIQNNADPWKDKKSDYQNNLTLLKRLSSEALAQNPKPDLVVWSETAFVPMIYWHIHYRTDVEYYSQVKELLEFFAASDVPFLIGNDDGRLVDIGGYKQRVDYNAAILFEKNEIIDVYRKMHLVPFTEHFPYEKQFPFIASLLRKLDTHVWEKGAKPVVFKTGKLKFSTPICFEDTFGYLTRTFVQNGAELIVNISNDSWSHSLTGQMQHLSMAVFRSVENNRSMVRSTASGQTCGILPNGKIIAMSEPFTATHLTVNVPLMDGETFYTKHGDYFPILCMMLAAFILLCGTIKHIIAKYAKLKKNTDSR
ncbi:apolipoprotein N-acyltransferase 1 [Spirochaetia bacterium]|nr:apolipoprotein N-acyltransferase 1 [Spirochaetia bacterium]